MKNLLFVMTALFCLSTAAMAAETAAPAAEAKPVAAASADKAAAKAAKFEAAKQKRLAKVTARIEELQKVQTCVSAATDAAAMKACKPVKKSKGCGGE